VRDDFNHDPLLNVDLLRSSGVLLHPTSLPNARLDAEAYRFVDWLAAAGQGWWQVLPLGPGDETGSPYASPSAFAGNPALLADPEAPVDEAEVAAFRERNAYWIDDWEQHEHGGPIADQVRFDREWRALRAYAADRGVRIIGDMPIYVAENGADHRAHPDLFQEGVVAGVPPDAFSDTGQLWGNPLYDWHEMRADGYRWWIERFRRAFDLVDLTRVDHFRGFVSYWAVPQGHATAQAGRWRRGPGRELFDAVEGELGRLPLIAEDLGVITEPVRRLRRELGFPGMLVLQFAFDGSPDNPYLPEHHQEDMVVYTGTHDNDTSRGWWESLTPEERARTPLDPADPVWSLIELALSSPARLAIVPFQDVLDLGPDARMNLPGSSEGNWAWRYDPAALTEERAHRLAEMTRRHGR
jgi:4-alpha-glucanotransferase